VHGKLIFNLTLTLILILILKSFVNTGPDRVFSQMCVLIFSDVSTSTRYHAFQIKNRYNVIKR